MAPSPQPHVQTVLGPVDPATLGFTLPHEHTAIALWHIQGRWDYWELTRDEPIITAELARFRDAGGTALADLTLPGNGRDPGWLVRLARATGLHLVMGGGWYREAYYPAEALINRRTVDDLADELVREAEEGIAVEGLDAPVQPGILGEIGTDKPWLSAQEERVHRAVARAARRTGLAISTHAVMSPVGLAQLDVFEAEGADLTRIVIGHADSYPVLEHYLEIIRRGASLEFDFLGMTFTPQERHGEPRIIDLLLELLSRGHADRVLVSQDVCHNQQLHHYEGNGYTYLQDTFLPRLRTRGVSDAEIDQLTIQNPRRILTIG
ncbi:MAG: phosphotriesterase-related protein [Chloroflexota bacterium]|nr:MAG: phosphotriesterase-related protein [Chloroflexota bacterium]